MRNPFSVKTGGQLVEVTRTNIEECCIDLGSGKHDPRVFQPKERKGRQYANSIEVHGRGTTMFGGNMRNIQNAK